MYFLKYKFVLRTNTLIVSMFILDIQLNLVVAQKCLSLYCSLPYYQLLPPPYYQLLLPPLLSATTPSPTIRYCSLPYYQLLLPPYSQLLLPPLLSATAPLLLSATAPSPTISYCTLPYYLLLLPPLLSATAPFSTISYCSLPYYQLLLPPLLSATAPSLTYQLLYTNCSLIYKYLILGHLDIKPWTSILSLLSLSFSMTQSHTRTHNFCSGVKSVRQTQIFCIFATAWSKPLIFQT